MTLRRKNWFFELTSTALKRGTRFNNQDRPNSATMGDMLDSSIFKTEPGDKAKEDVGTYSAEINGHVVLATNEQILNYESQKSDRSLVVQPSQLSEVEEAKNTGELKGYDLSDGIVDIEKDLTEKRRNKYLVKLKDVFVSWLQEFRLSYDAFVEYVSPRLIPDGGTEGDVLQRDAEGEATWGGVSDKFLEDLSATVTESIESDVDFVVVIDGTSINTGDQTTILEQMVIWYDRFKEVNPWYQGNIYFYTINTQALEGYLKWASLYGLNYNRDKIVMVGFMDEAATIYHSLSLPTSLSEGTTSSYRDDYNNFIADYDKFEFFKAILYAVPAVNNDTRGSFHGHIYKAVEAGTVADADFIDSPIVTGLGYSLDFIKTSNPYANEPNTASLSGNYAGLSLYGWVEFHDFSATDINNKLTAEEFDSRIQTALFGEELTNTITTTITGTMESGTELIAESSFGVPIAQIDWNTYKNLPNPVNAAEITALAEGTLYYLTASQVGLTANTVLSLTDKFLFAK